MENKGVIIQGSARSFGNTNKVVKLMAEKTGFDIKDLNDFIIGQYDYDNKNKDDDFLPLMREIIENYDTIIFATPVYWYSMSGVMKTFFDRITELLKTEKELGRKLRGMSMALISSSEDPNLINGFTIPFSESANYLGMKYLGDIHIWLEDEVVSETLKERIDEFVGNINNN